MSLPKNEVFVKDLFSKWEQIRRKFMNRLISLEIS